MGKEIVGMGDHVVLDVGRLATAAKVEADANDSGSSAATTSEASQSSGKTVIAVDEEEEPLLQSVECRICQEEDGVKNLDTPCACSGSLKFAHKACLQRWINEKGDLTCEICHEPYKTGYVAPPRTELDDTTIDLGGGWAISGTLDLHDPRILAMAAAQHRLLEAQYDEDAARNSGSAAFCRSISLILLALLLLRHAMTITGGDESDDGSEYFSLFLLRVAGFLLPCYIMVWLISILYHRRQQQETASALAASEVAFFLRSGQVGGLQVTIVPESPATPQHETPQREAPQQTV